MRTVKNPPAAFCFYLLAFFFTVDLFTGYLKATHLFPHQTLENVHVPDARLGWKPELSGRGHHAAPGLYDVIYEMDEKGARRIDNPENPSRRIFFFGDSFTFGQGVSNSETFPALLANRFRGLNTAVYNYGVMGYGITQMAVRFLEIEPEIKPGDVVVFSPTTADLSRDISSFTFLMSLQFSNRVAPFEKFPVFMNGNLEYRRIGTAFDRLRFIAECAPFTGRALRRMARQPNDEESQKMNLQILRKVKDLTEKKGATFRLFFLPMEQELSMHEYFIDIAYLGPVDILPSFGPGPFSGFYFSDGHLNHAGHEVVAAAIEKFLRETITP